MDYSLRAYVSILYKVPRMQIFIRDKKVKTKRIAGLLSQKETEMYKPYGVAESIKIELGFNTENKNLYGMMLYHRNRLIKAYMRVGMQLEENERGMGVIGLAEADFLQPTHNKQDFDDTTAYRRLLKKLADVLAEYWWEKKERVNVLQIQQETRRRGPAGAQAEDVPDTNWVQCDNPTCLKWRVLPPGTAVEKLPDIWYCEYHPDPKYRRHEEPEQEWDTTIQHEITERRRERKREYDKEKKEREAEKKRQRLEAATRESVALLEKQKEELAKEIQEQLERERQGLEEQKRREEEVKKLNEEWTLIKEDCARMESKREEMLNEQKELEKQLVAAQEELARKAKEKEEFSLLQAQKEAEKAAQLEAENAARIEAEKLAEREAENEAARQAEEERSDEQSQGQTLLPVENGHVSESTINDNIPHSNSRKVGGSRNERGTPIKEKRGSVKGIAPVSTTRLPHLLPEVTRIPQDIEANGSHTANNSEPCLLSLASPGSVRRRTKQDQASLPPRHGKSAAPPREDGPCVPAGNRKQLERNGTSSLAGTDITNESKASSKGRSRKHGSAAQTSQTPLLEWGPKGNLPNPVQGNETGARLLNGEAPSTASPSSWPEVERTVQANAMENTLTSNQQGNADVSPSDVDQRSTVTSDPAHQRKVVSDDRITESLVSTGQQVALAASTDGENQDPAAPQADTSVRSGGPQGQSAANVSKPGSLCIDLPMDTVFRSESIRTLDKEFYSSQRRLRLALNTLVKIGGLNDGRVYDLDQLPIRDEEVIQLCEKTQENVEAKLAKCRQDVASLKAELAYLMADKYQHGPGQGWNFKIQSVINKWGVMEVNKKS